MPTPLKTSTYVHWFVLPIFLFFLWPHDFYNTPVPGIDASWNIAVHLARQYHLVFGKDFVFTYGPLEVLETRLPIAINRLLYLFFDVYFLGTFLWIVRRLLRANAGAGTLIYLFLCVLAAGGITLNQWYFLFFLYFLFSYVAERNNRTLLGQAALLSVISLFIKVSLGMTTLAIFVAFLTFSVVFKRISFRQFAMFSGMYAALVLLSAWWLNVSIPAYIKGNLQLISYYNDSMMKPLIGDFRPFIYPALGTVLVTCASFLAVLYRAIRKRRVREDADLLFIYCMLAFSSFVLFKSSFVRSGTHIYLFYEYISPLAGFLFLYSPSPARRLAAIASWAILLPAIWALRNLPGSQLPVLNSALPGGIKGKAVTIGRYFRQVVDYDRELRRSDSLQTADNEYRKIIGNGTVDVIPIEISTVYFNGLRYNPRPVIQSYCAYSEYLDELNYRKYMSADAPDYLIFTVGSVDERIPFFDETRTKLAILDRYEVAGRIKEDLILRKRPTGGRLQETREADTTQAPLGVVMPVKRNGGIQVTQVFIRYSALGTFFRTFYQPPRLHIVLTLEDGTVITRQVIKPILADGVVLNKYIDSRDEFRLLMEVGGRLNTNIRSVLIAADDPAAMGFADSVKLVTRTYSLAAMGRDSLALANISSEYDAHPPREIDAKQYIPDSAHNGWDDISSSSFFIRIVGYAFREKADNSALAVHPAVRSGDKVYEFPSEVMERADLTFAFKRKDILHAGFNGGIMKSQLPPGKYQVGVVMYDHRDGKKYLSFTDNLFNNPPPETIGGGGRIDPRNTGKDNLQMAVDSLVPTNDQVLIKGWAFLKGPGKPGEVSWLVLRGRAQDYRIPVQHLSSEKVTGYFGDSRYAHCGFQATVQKSVLPEGEYDIGVAVTGPGAKDTSVRFDGRRLYVDTAESPEKIASLPPVKDFPLGIDVFKDQRNSITLAGWAVADTGKIDDDAVEVVFTTGNTSFIAPAQLRSRPDVKVTLKSTLNLDNSGFYARIPKAGLPPGKYRVGIYLHHNGEPGAVKFIDQLMVKE